jgi:hypothetical protein
MIEVLWIANEPLLQVLKCDFGVLALESHGIEIDGFTTPQPDRHSFVGSKTHGATKAELEDALGGRILVVGQLMETYKR